VIDGLRFLAILPVVLQHLCERVIRISEQSHLATASDYALISLLPTGYLGVELFFVISGLIISYPFVGAHFRGQQHPSLRNFYLRRITRLEPPYFLVMIGCYFFVRLAGYFPQAAHISVDTSTNLETSLAASLIYLHWLLVDSMPKLNPPAWSLEIEIQFYILAPIILLAVLRLRQLGPIALGILALSAGSIYASHPLEIHYGSWPPLPLLKVFHLFLAGILVNVITFGGLVPHKIPRAVWDLGFVTAIAILYIIDKHDDSMFAAAAQVSCYLVLFLAAFEGMLFRSFLSLPWIFTIGGMCYTIYLIHLPILLVLTGVVMQASGVVRFLPGLLICLVVILPILFGVSVAFFLLIEKPCMNPHWPLGVGNWLVGWALRMRPEKVATKGQSQSRGSSELS
jgi:peptidoglycan/LPS O-acetylase OafA/YrhL